MISRVVLQNFISHRDTDIRLGKGVTVFVGPNGAGKSTVVDGITYALYGEHVRGSNEALVRKGTTGASAAVEFGVRSRTFVAERKLDRRGGLEGAVLWETTGGVKKQLAAGERKQFDESTTSGEVGRVLGLDYERMRVAAIIQQGELDSIIRDFSPKEFKELVSTLIGIDGLEVAYQKMLEVVGSFRSHLRDLYGFDDTNLAALEAAVVEKQGSLRANREGFDKTEKALQILRAHESDLNRWMSKAEPLREKAIRLKDHVEALLKYVESKKTELGEEKAELERVVGECRRYLPIVAGGAAVSAAVEKAKLESRKNDDTIEELTDTIAGLRSQKERPNELGKVIVRAKESFALLRKVGDVDTRLKVAESGIRKIEGRLKSTTKEKGKWEANMETAKKLEFKDGICPYCGSRVSGVKPIFDPQEIENHLKAHEKEIADLESSKSGLESGLESLRTEANSASEARSFLASSRIGSDDDVDKLQAERSELEEKLRKVPRYATLLAKAKASKKTLAAELERLNNKQAEASEGRAFLKEHKVSSREDVKRLSRRKAELNHLLSRLPGDLDAIEGMPDREVLRALAIDAHSRELLGEIRVLTRQTAKFDEKQYMEKGETLKNLTTKVIPAQTANAQVFKTQSEKDEAELENWENASVELRRAEEFTGLLTKVRERVYHRDGPVPSSLRSWALNHIGLKASEFARSFNIGVSSIQLKETKSHVSIECYGSRGSVETTALSGGEKVAIALALRFGMAYVMGGYKLDFVILDEPTIHLDPERRATMVDIVSGLGAEDSPIKQTVIITHDAEIFEDADVDAVYRFENSPEGTKVSPVA